MNILYFSPVPFMPVYHGNMSTIYQYVRRMKKLGHKVHFVYLDECHVNTNSYYLMRKEVDTFDFIPLEYSKKNQRDKQNYYIFDSKYVDSLGEIIRDLCEKYSIDAVFCTYVFQSKILEYVPKNVLKIIDTHDKMSDRHLALKKNKIKDEFFSCTSEDEAKYLNRADVIIARREEEKEYFNKITKSSKTIMVSHFEDAIPLNREYKKLHKIGVLASNNMVNFKMVTEFLKKFDKRFKSEPIDIEVIVAGQIKELFFKQKKFRKLSNAYYTLLNRPDKIKDNVIRYTKEPYINFVGKVPNIDDFYRDVDVVLIPIEFGTGINVKMVQGMAYGAPVVSTECGIKGMDSSSPFHHCKNIDELIDKIYEIYGNPYILQKLSTESKECYKSFLDKSQKNFDELFKSNLVTSV